MKEIDWKIDTQGIEKTPEKLHKVSLEATGQVMEKARQVAREKAPVQSGRLKGTAGGMGQILFRIEENGFEILGILSATARNPETGFDYAPAVHEGTGVFGPKKKRIFPKKAKVLVFMKDPLMPRPTTPQGWKDARLKKLVIYARSIKGQESQPFLKWGLEEAQKNIPRIFDLAIEALNKRES